MQIYRKVDRKLVPAPRVLPPAVPGGDPIDAPELEDFAAAGMYPYRPVTPESRAGYIHRISDYVVEDGAWVPVWAYDPVPNLPVTYSKRKFMLACAQAGVFASIKAWMESTEIITGSGLTAWELLSQSQFLRSDDDDFKMLRAAAVSQYGEERVAQILEASVDEEA